jgi:hypothetical protein
MRKCLVAAIALLLPGVASGQQSKWFGMTWSMSTPAGPTKTFVSDYSLRGIGLDWRRVGGNKSFGLSLGWNALNQETFQTSSIDQVDVTGDQFRYINAYSILLSGHVYGGGSGRARPFLGVKVGTYYLERRVDVGLWTASDDNWHLGVAPELGFAVPLRGSPDGEVFYTAVRYNYAVAAGDTPFQSWVGIDVGIAVRKW